MPTLKFPTLKDREHIHNLINHYAHGKCSRNDLMRWIANIIEKYGIQRMPIFGYSVRILQYYKDLPIISIEGAKVVDTCPGCSAGTNHARYLRTEKEDLHGTHDIVSVTCLECGCVYMISAPNGRESKAT
ncbi:MAG TPA: hypothetical protein VFC84_00275 [Desulfosporosinus sp.]|nr:hypothetical protein [Desulfosporosinus sp.]